ncbi:MAG TPA: type II secretion system F family protein [archaeon]|nr:type II secretion system F family protein [archaeon]
MALIKNIPFVPFSMYQAVRISRKIGLIGTGSRASKLFPKLSLYLLQTGISFEDREYTAIAILAAMIWFIIPASIFTVLYFFVLLPSNFITIALLSSFGLSFLSFFYVILFPQVVITRRIKDLEKNLLFALRHLLIQVRSGIPLFDSMVSVSKAGYGLISEEFEFAVKQISTGVRDIDALEEIALKNPSLYFRRSMWQITNAIRSGADIANTLDTIIGNLANEQRILVRRYGSQLNPLAFMYMMMGIILPSLGISLMISLSSFSGLKVERIFFWAILIFLIFFKFNFLGIVKSRRPSVEVYV